jgi:hypothetical protein
MASNINQNNIDGAYPVAGQDNDSQGFRDNFTNTKTNFGYAAAEITDLQNKAVLKAALTGGTLNNNMAGSLLSNAQLQDMSETKVALGTTSGTVTIDYSAGPYYSLTTSGSVSLSFTNFSTAGTVSRVRVQITVTNLAYTLTLPAAVSVNIYNIQGIDSNVITFNATGVYEYEFETSDNGTTITVFDLSQNPDPIWLPSFEDLGDTEAASLSVTTSLFSTAAPETATLAAGREGQYKVLAMFADTGDMVITVTNAGWKSSGTGTITFGEIGDACTMLYVNNKWFCIGNNGCVFG